MALANRPNKKIKRTQKSAPLIKELGNKLTMKTDLKKDIIILNLLIGWEVIHLTKRGRKVTIRLREFPGKPNRFLRVTFSKCDVAVIIDFNNGQIENFSYFNFKACTIGEVNLQSDGIISIFLYNNNIHGGILKILSDEVSHDFTSR